MKRKKEIFYLWMPLLLLTLMISRCSVDLNNKPKQQKKTQESIEPILIKITIKGEINLNDSTLTVSTNKEHEDAYIFFIFNESKKYLDSTYNTILIDCYEDQYKIHKKNDSIIEYEHYKYLVDSTYRKHEK